MFTIKQGVQLWAASTATMTIWLMSQLFAQAELIRVPPHSEIQFVHGLLELATLPKYPKATIVRIREGKGKEVTFACPRFQLQAAVKCTKAATQAVGQPVTLGFVQLEQARSKRFILVSLAIETTGQSLFASDDAIRPFRSALQAALLAITGLSGLLGGLLSILIRLSKNKT